MIGILFSLASDTAEASITFKSFDKSILSKVVAKHESTVWKIMDKGTGFNAKDDSDLKAWPEW